MSSHLDEAQQQGMVAWFLDIAEGQNSATARHFLDATGWNLEEALQLFYSTFSADVDVVANSPQQQQHDSSSSAGHQHGEEDGDQDHLHLSSSADGHDENMIIDDEDQQEGYVPAETTETPPANQAENNLHTLFSPPFGLMYWGPFERAKNAAKLSNKWLLVNLQDEREFNSHMLNRDTWRNEAVVEIIKNNFVFWQENNRSEEGSKVCTYYKLDAFPTILVIEPITGMKLQILIGMVSPENMAVNLLNFLDSNPNPIDYCVNQSHRNKHSDEEPKPESPKLDDDEGFKFPPLPEEPEVDDPKISCRVGVRLPGGHRIQRRFLRSDPIQLLWSLCCSKVEEAEKRPFRVGFSSPAGFKWLDYGSDLSFEESDLGNCMLSFAWVD